MKFNDILYLFLVFFIGFPLAILDMFGQVLRFPFYIFKECVEDL